MTIRARSGASENCWQARLIRFSDSRPLCHENRLTVFTPTSVIASS